MAQTRYERALRRARTYARRIAAMPGGGLRHPLFFMHLPKCGGTSIAEALYATIPMQQRVGVVDADATRRAAAMHHADRDEVQLFHDDLPTGQEVYRLREDMLLTHMAWNTAIIHGHILFSEKADRHFGSTYRYVTVMRDPVQRTLSNYAHSMHDGLIPDDFDTYLESFTGRAHGLTFLRYFSGRHVIPPDAEEAALAEAKQTLAKFAVVGFLDDLPGFVDQFGEVFGRKPRIYRYNEHKWPKYVPTDAQMDRLRHLLKTEIEFWNHAEASRRNPNPIKDATGG